MEEQRRWSGPPRIPTNVRNSAVATLGKSKAAGSTHLRRAARRSASYDWLTRKQEPPTSPRCTPRAQGEEGGDIQPPAPAPAPPLTASPPRPPAVRRCVSAGEIPTSRTMEPLSACSVFFATALQLGRPQRETEAGKSGQQGRGRSPRGGSRSPGPSLTRRVSGSASPRGHGGSTDGLESSGSSGSSSKRGDSKRFYEYWSYYNSRPASVVRSATSEMADDILSSGDDDDIPIPSIAANTTRAQPAATKGTKGTIEGGAARAANESKRARAAGEAARASRAVALAKDRWANEARLRLQELRKHSGNTSCADCGAPCADWASVAHGSFVCLDCAGQHRSLGMHVTFTRSLTMDKWTERRLCSMEAGGNRRLAEFSRRIGLYPWSTIQDKYAHPCLPLYREHIVALADGEDPPPISREALEKAVLAASGEEASDLDDEDDATSTRSSSSSSSSSSSCSSLDSAEESDTTSDQLTSIIRNVSGGCGGIGHALRRWSCGRPAARGTRAGGRGGGEGEAQVGKQGSAGVMGGGGEAPSWVPDDEKEACMVCDRKFTLMLRRHHCRRCGRLSCNLCAPTNNTRPIVEWGFPQAVRHCRLCYRSPLLEWPDRPSD